MTTTKTDAQGCPFHVGSALVILATDWLVNVVNVRTAAQAFWWVDLAGALVVAGLVATIELRHHGASGPRSGVLALIAALAVALPLPLAGTVLAIAVLTWHAVTSGHRSSI